MSLQQFISPISNSVFVEEFKGEQYFLNKGFPGKFSKLFSWEKLNEILATHRLEYPRLRLIQNGNVIDQKLYTTYKSDKRGGVIAEVDAHKLLLQLKGGTAMHLLSIEEFDAGLRAICDRISQELFSEVSMTMHIGIFESKGFNAHWDAHDVFVVQVSGRKKWKLFGATEKYSFRTGPSLPQDHNLPTIWEGDVDEGDVLYLPRGCWHDVEAYDEASMHISIGMYNPKLVDYMGWLCKQMVELAFFRKDIPINQDGFGADEFLTQLQSEVGGLISAKTLNAYLKSLVNKRIDKNFNLPYNSSQDENSNKN